MKRQCVEWISVEERDKIPEDLEDILFTDGEFVFKGHKITLDDSVLWYSCTEFKIDNITHWMPLPKPPKIDKLQIIKQAYKEIVKSILELEDKYDITCDLPSYIKIDDEFFFKNQLHIFSKEY